MTTPSILSQADLQILEHDEVLEVVAIGFNGYKPGRSQAEFWVGHVLENRVISAGALAFYEDEPDKAGIHTGCVLPEFRQRGLHLELLKMRIEIARQHHKKYAVCHAYHFVTRKNLLKLGFQQHEDDTSHFSLRIDH